MDREGGPPRQRPEWRGVDAQTFEDRNQLPEIMRGWILSPEPGYPGLQGLLRGLLRMEPEDLVGKLLGVLEKLEGPEVLATHGQDALPLLRSGHAGPVPRARRVR